MSIKDQIRAEIERRLSWRITLEARAAYNNILRFLDTLPEQPVEGLEEAAHNFAIHYDNGTCDGTAQDCFIAGAEWQREQIMDEWLKDRDGCFWDGVEEGKKAMEKQMMKEAVEGKIQMRYSGCLCATTIRAINEDKFKFGDKVRVIVIKEDGK